jgi:hypothetical protein
MSKRGLKAKRGFGREDKRRARARTNLYRIDGLERRVLLSADFLGAVPRNLFVNDTQDYVARDAAIVDDVFLGLGDRQGTSDRFDTASLASTDTGTVLDISKLPSADVLDGVLVIPDGTLLKGSDVTDLDVVNRGTVAPGYSPGSQTVATFSQGPGGTLEVEIAGLVAGTEYDQLNVTGAADFGGTLSVLLLDGFKPQIGDTFDIITFGSATGILTNLTGLYGFNSDYYFELVQTEHTLQLVTRELISGNDFAFVSTDIGSKNDTLGMLVNFQYLTSVAPTSLTLGGELNLGDSFHLSGQVTFDQNSVAKNLKLSDATTVSVTSLTLGGRDITAFFGVNPGAAPDKFGLSFTDLDFGLALFEPVDQLDTRKWVIAEGSLDGVSFLGLDDLSFSAGNIAFALDLGLGDGNSTVVNLSDPADTVVISDVTGELGTCSAGHRIYPCVQRQYQRRFLVFNKRFQTCPCRSERNSQFRCGRGKCRRCRWDFRAGHLKDGWYSHGGIGRAVPHRRRLCVDTRR